MRGDNTYTWSDYESDIIKAALPWIAFGILAFIVLIAAIVLRFLRCICCKQQIKQRGRCIRLTCIVSSFIATFFALLTCAFLIYYSDQTFQSFQQVQCAAGRIPYSLSYGSSGKNWVGLLQSLENMQQITFNLENIYPNATSQLWTGADWMSNEYFDSVIESFYNNFSNFSVTNPNPFASFEVLTAYTKNLGPINDSKSNAGAINYEFSLKVLPALSTMIDLYTLTTGLNSEIPRFLTIANSSIANLTTFISGNQDINQNVENWVLNNQNQIISSWRSFTFGIVFWGWFICIGVLLTVYSQAMAKPFIANGLCCFWLFTGMIAVVGFLASAGTLAVGLVANDSCGLFNDLFTTQGVNTYNVIIPGNVSVYINTCLNGNGDIGSLINLTQFLNTLQLMSYDNLTLASAPVSIGLGNFTSMNANKAIVKFPIDYNKVLDSSVAKIFTPGYNLAILNSYTNKDSTPTYQGNCTTYTFDVWVFAEDFCDETHIYIRSDAPTKQIGTPSCLVIEEWSSSEVNQRYKPYLACKGNYTSYIEAYQDSLFEYQYTTDDLYSEINVGLGVVNATIYDYVYKMIAQSQKIQNYFTSPDQELLLMNAALDSKTGLYNGLNCSYIHDYSLSLKDSMCSNSLENTYEVFVFVFLLSFLMLTLELINLYLSRALLKGE